VSSDTTSAQFSAGNSILFNRLRLASGMQSLTVQAKEPKGEAMKTWTKIRITKSLTVTAAAVAMAIQTAAQQVPAANPAPKPPVTQHVRQIVVSLEDRKLALIEDGQVKKIYSVAVGKPSTPSPEGTFTIERRVANPVYHHGDRTVEAGPNNPVGTRWMGLSTKGYGIHGTNEPKSIGQAASHGCIRMAKADLEEFYALVAVGDQVQIVGAHNDQTARLFVPVPALTLPDGPIPSFPAYAPTVQLAQQAAAVPAVAAGSR
jgi:lipoprotein-anchoring transpeptidase ErfK/SrfK